MLKQPWICKMLQTRRLKSLPVPAAATKMNELKITNHQNCWIRECTYMELQLPKLLNASREKCIGFPFLCNASTAGCNGFLWLSLPARTAQRIFHYCTTTNHPRRASFPGLTGTGLICDGGLAQLAVSLFLHPCLLRAASTLPQSSQTRQTLCSFVDWRSMAHNLVGRFACLCLDLHGLCSGKGSLSCNLLYYSVW